MDQQDFDFLCNLKKMAFLEAEYSKSVFFEYYKIIENIQSIGSWYCICHEYSGYQKTHSFIKNKRRYCCVCQFQDRFNLWELNEIKRQINKLKRYYMEILTAVCEIIVTRQEIIWKLHNFFCLCYVPAQASPQSFRKGTKSSGKFQ